MSKQKTLSVACLFLAVGVFFLAPMANSISVEGMWTTDFGSFMNITSVESDGRVHGFYKPEGSNIVDEWYTLAGVISRSDATIAFSVGFGATSTSWSGYPYGSDTIHTTWILCRPGYTSRDSFFVGTDVFVRQK